MNNLKSIEDEDLSINDIPKEFEKWEIISKFALTIPLFKIKNAYGSGVVKKIDMEYEINNELSNCTLSELREYLFLIQRSCNHRGEAPDIDLMKRINNILNVIRNRISH